MLEQARLGKGERSGQDEKGDELRPLLGERERDQASEAVGDDRRRRDAERVQPVGDLPRLVARRAREARPLAHAMAGAVDEGDAMPVCELCGRAEPVMMCGQRTVDEEEVAPL